jgi:hypothetical protein
LRDQAIRFTLLVTLLCALIGCSGPTIPGGPDTFTLQTTMDNTSGAATILDAQILYDNLVIADSCPQNDQYPITDVDGNILGDGCTAPPVRTVAFSAGNNTAPGSHHLDFFMSSQSTAGTPTPYQVAAFTLTIVGSGGKVIKTIPLPAMSGSLGGGRGSITYIFSF